ncbi:transducin/WD40 repeat-like superfamily protein [Tasmannia lanceolata]|uniref:transducin/WD40 repeat-like superfamily protein n=1 Tax=Tasmannia lanceolata TaxID=3420 RepID=UPI004063BAE7
MSSSSSSSSGGGETEVFRIGRQIGEPSSSRIRQGNGVWPEPFVEELAVQVAVNAAGDDGRLAAGPALAGIFQVCSTWRAVSRSELLWQNLTRRIWGQGILHRPSWREEYIHRHRTAHNFRIRRAVYTHLEFEAGSNEDGGGSSCSCLALSSRHLAAGFLDGSARLFDLPTRRNVSTFRPYQRDRLGRFSCAVSGIIMYGSRVVFASLGGDIHVADLHDPSPNPTRRAHMGNVVNDGTLVDFTGCSRWWVGLYAGVPGRALHVWNSDTEELVFVGGSLTDPDSVQGWHLLTELTESVGRVRVSSEDESGLACTSFKVMVFDLRNHGIILGEEEPDQGVIVDSVDVSNRHFLVIDNRGLARVRRVRNLEEVCRFVVRRGGGAQQRVLGCLNTGYAFVFNGGVIRVWDAEKGRFLYRLREGIGEANALVAGDDHVAGCSPDTGIHLWDFSGGED